MPYPKTEMERLQDQVDSLTEEVAFLRRSLGMMTQAPAKWGLTNKENRLWGRLLLGGVVTHMALTDALYDLDRDGPDSNTVRVLVHRLRKRIAPHGLEIENHNGLGYSLPPETIERYRRDWETK